MKFMNYLDFHKQWSKLGCFSIHQIYAWESNFNRLNITNWVKKGYLIKLRKDWYAFRDCLSIPDFSQLIANKIYAPSYISLHYALSYYGMIPEAVMKLTSVTSLKTESFTNEFGEFTYQTVKPSLMFGYVPKMINDGLSILFATPEKALLDLLYLYPFYNTEEDMLNLRLDEDYMTEDFDKELFLRYASEIGSVSLTKRVETLIKTYEI